MGILIVSTVYGQRKCSLNCSYTVHTHTHTHIYIFICKYVYICVCVLHTVFHPIILSDWNKHMQAHAQRTHLQIKPQLCIKDTDYNDYIISTICISHINAWHCLDPSWRRSLINPCSPLYKMNMVCHCRTNAIGTNI